MKRGECFNLSGALLQSAAGLPCGCWPVLVLQHIGKAGQQRMASRGLCQLPWLVGHLFSLLGSRKMLQGNRYLQLHPALILLSWMEGPGCAAVGSRGSRLGRAVVGMGRRFITREGAVGKGSMVYWVWFRLGVQKPGLSSS